MIITFPCLNNKLLYFIVLQCPVRNGISTRSNAVRMKKTFGDYYLLSNINTLAGWKTRAVDNILRI